MLNVLYPFLISKMLLVMTTAVNKLITTPKLKETAKPLIGPVPNWNKTRAVIKVVTCESTMVKRALLYPASMEALTVFPVRSSSLILSNIKTLASTDIPTIRIIPAIPGMVRVACRAAMAARRKKRLKNKAKSAISPETR